MEIKDCNCLEKTAELIIEKVKENEKKTKGFHVIEGDWENKSSYPKVRLYANFIVKSTFEKKDGTRSRPQNHNFSLFFPYCPFCGKKFDIISANQYQFTKLK